MMTVDEMMVLARLACAEEFLRGQHVGKPGYREHRYGTETALAQLEVGVRAAIAEALDQGEPAAQPVGEWQWVPKEPTDAMLNATNVFDVNTTMRRHIYRSMLKATPQAQPAVPVAHQYLFDSPWGGEVWRYDSHEWNGNKPKASRALYAAKDAQP